ncbi:MAG TPA: hypothetical protein VNI52_06770 [Sphingobacteriaceae bacterium]|nr:hypothetical protein [Sphingobacteriaceae bacterium]
MRKEIASKLFSILFLSIFLLKMVISGASLLIAHFDKQTVNEVIMQLEIENNAKSNEGKEKSVKEYFTWGSFGFALLHFIPLTLPSMISIDHDKHVQAFYPPVPTPPPNV